VALNNSTLHEAKASDEWGYYQAKSIKQRISESERDLMARSVDPASEAGKKELDKIDAKIAKYATEMEDASKTAKSLEAQQRAAHDLADHSSAQGGVMGLAVSIFQIAIAMASICLVMKRKELWYVSMGLAALGTLEMIRAWLT
jgi:chromosome segregation ATPase